METFKVTLTVVEPMEIVGFVEDEDAESAIANLTPKLIERWGEGNYGILDVSLADDEEKAILADAINKNKKELN